MRVLLIDMYLKTLAQNYLFLWRSGRMTSRRDLDRGNSRGFSMSSLLRLLSTGVDRCDVQNRMVGTIHLAAKPSSMGFNNVHKCTLQNLKLEAPDQDQLAFGYLTTQYAFSGNQCALTRIFHDAQQIKSCAQKIPFPAG